MKRILALTLVTIMIFSIFTGCSEKTSVEKIVLADAKYSVREPGERILSDEQAYKPGSDSYLVDTAFLSVIQSTIDLVPAAAYVIDFSGTRGEFENIQLAEEFVESYFESVTNTNIILKSELSANGIWGALADGELVDDIQQIWLNRYEDLDGNMEYVADISRNSQPLRSLRFIFNDGDAAPQLIYDRLSANNSGYTPKNLQLPSPETGSGSGTAYYRGFYYRTGIYELPVLGSVDFSFVLDGKPVPGDVAGGFAGMYEGSVTIDGVTLTLTANGNDIPVPTGIVENPADWYIAFSKVSFNNPQDKTGYRNVYYIAKDGSEIVGLYQTYKTASFNEWFHVTRISKSAFESNVADNNKKLTDLYGRIMIDAYGSKKEYNNTLAVLFNMLIGVEQQYIKKNLPEKISSMSKDIRDYAECYTDETIARLGENGYWFFPDGRSTVIRLYEYDGTTAIAAVDFSTKQDSGYGGLYSAEYINGNWELTVLKDTRIKGN